MGRMVQTQKKIALLHRFPAHQIKETNAAFPYLKDKGIHVLTYKTFNRLNKWEKFFKDLAWLFYAPSLVFGKGYEVIYCDDSFPIYAAFVKMASPRSKVILRIGDLHLMYYFDGLMYEILHFLEKISWNMVDWILPISYEMAKFIYEDSGVPGLIVLDPVAPKDFSFNIGKINHGSVMFHGYLTKNKNVDILLRAAEMLPEINFVVIGDGPDKKRLQKLAPDNVFFKGWVNHKSISHHIATCAVGVALRSNNRGNQYVVTSAFLQYGMMGKPCLVTRREVFGDYLWQFDDAIDLVQKIKCILKVKGFAESEGQKLRESVLEHHSAPKIAEEIWSMLVS